MHIGMIRTACMCVANTLPSILDMAAVAGPTSTLPLIVVTATFGTLLPIQQLSETAMNGFSAAASIWSLCEATSALLKYFNM
jgi:hypothetical protein